MNNELLTAILLAVICYIAGVLDMANAVIQAIGDMGG